MLQTTLAHSVTSNLDESGQKFCTKLREGPEKDKHIATFKEKTNHFICYCTTVVVQRRVPTP